MYRFVYFRKTGEYRRYVVELDDFEYDGDEGYDFEYEVDSDEVKDALIGIIADDDEYFAGISKGDLPYSDRLIIAGNFVELIDDLDGLDGLVERYDEELHDAFYDEAMEWEAE